LQELKYQALAYEQWPAKYSSCPKVVALIQTYYWATDIIISYMKSYKIKLIPTAACIDDLAPWTKESNNLVASKMKF
jgi:hypothetical protein